MFPESVSHEMMNQVTLSNDMMNQTTITTVQAGNGDERIYLASDLEYAMIPVTDGSGHTVVQQVTVQVMITVGMSIYSRLSFRLP